MTPSDRINVIREIARRLENEDWPLIDLTLKQFALPWTDQWQGGEKSGYVIDMISAAEDETLLQLASHLGYEYQTPKSVIEPQFWRPDHFRLFISHLAANRGKATLLQEQLLNFHISSFVAHKDIQPTTEWEEEILLGLSTCDALVALLDPGFHASFWTDQEIGFVMGKGLLVMTVALGEMPYGFMGRFQACDGKGKSDRALSREISQILIKNKQTAKWMVYALMSKFESSDSFRNAMNNLTLLEKATYWDQTLTHRLQSLVDNNRQISDAYGVPIRIASLIAKWS